MVQQVVLPGHLTSTQDQIAGHGHTSVTILTSTQDQVAEDGHTGVTILTSTQDQVAEHHWV